jgi:hypothetical protein
MVMSHEGMGTKNDCAGEGQQQFTDSTKLFSRECTSKDVWGTMC